MIAKFTAAALTDLEELREYLGTRSPSGHQSVVAAIRKVITLVSENPSIGRQSILKDVREVIEPKYGFLISYLVKGDVLYVLRVYRNKRRPLGYDEIEMPE